MKTKTRISAPVSARIRLIAMMAMLAAASVVLGKFLQIPIGDSLRISFENLPVLFAGTVFGPFVGAAVGVVADLVGCVVVGYAINPIITLGAASIGFVSGILTAVFDRDRRFGIKSVALAVLVSHVIGSIIIKSIGLRLAYTTAWSVLALRVPIYLANIIVETLIITVLLRSAAIRASLKRFGK